MINFFKKNKPEADKQSLTWSAAALAALDQSLAAAPVPKLLKGKVKKELQQAAEQEAKKNGHMEVSAEDLMHGLLSRLPAGMQQKVNDALQKGPQGLKDLEEELKK